MSDAINNPVQGLNLGFGIGIDTPTNDQLNKDIIGFMKDTGVNPVSGQPLYWSQPLQQPQEQTVQPQSLTYTELNKEVIEHENMLNSSLNETKSKEDAVRLAEASYTPNPKKPVDFKVWKYNVDKYLELKAKSINKYIPSEEQYRALLTFTDRQLVEACPGSGKTTTMVSKVRVDGAVHGYDFMEQLVVTYTEAAANDMRDKYSKESHLFNQKATAVFFTLHAYGSLIQKTRNPLVKIIDPKKGLTIRVEDEEHKNDKFANMTLEEIEDMSFINADDDYDDEYDEEEGYKEVKLYLNGIISDAMEMCGLTSKYFNYRNEMAGFLSVLVEHDIKTEEEFLSIPKFADNPDLKFSDLQKIYKSARQIRIKYNCIDFSDMLLDVYSYLKELKNISDEPNTGLQAILSKSAIYVDEFQDISPLQMNIISELLRLNPQCRLFCVGDTDQGIYSFRGAEPKFLLTFPTLECNKGKKLDIIYFTINRRSGDGVISLSSDFIKLNKARYNKEMRSLSDKESNIKIYYDMDLNSTADKIYKDIIEMSSNQIRETAVLARENNILIPIVSRLIHAGVEISVRENLLPYMSREYKDLISVIEFTGQTNIGSSVKSILYKIFRKISKLDADVIGEEVDKRKQHFTAFLKKSKETEEDIEILREIRRKVVNEKPMKEIIPLVRQLYSEAFVKKLKKGMANLNYAYDFIMLYGDLSYNEFYREMIKLIERCKIYANSQLGVKILTMHRSKGLEFDNVYIFGLGDSYTPKQTIIDNLNPKYRIDYIEEERRLMYVAMTRSKKNLSIFFPDNGGIFKRELSNIANTNTNLSDCLQEI